MKKAQFAFAALIATPAFAQGSHYVQGYTRSNGTYVTPHYQTNPNGNAYDNWSSRPNVNPYTGQEGTRDPSQVREYGSTGYGSRSSGSSYDAYGNPR